MPTPTATHSFVVTTYMDSPYLPECLQSLKDQTQLSEIIITTATPSDTLRGVAKDFDIPIFVGDQKPTIARNWTYGYQTATTDYVTIAHQDDIYAPTFAEKTMAQAATVDNPIILFTDYGELRDDVDEVTNTFSLKLKRVLNAPLTNNRLQQNRLVRRRLLSIADGISAPTVTYNRKRFPKLEFSDEMATALDWDMWERLSNEDGAFIYIPEVLLMHRIHTQSETSRGIGQGRRRQVDYEMFRRFWPHFIAKPLAQLYALAESTNS